jgi:hypothetical protein
MTTIAVHPLAAKHHVVGVAATAVVTAGLSVGLTLALRPSRASHPAAHLTRADPVLCQELAQATPGSPAAIRLADVISTQGTC